MVMVCALRVTLPALLCLGLGGPAVAQQGGAYIDQITGSPTSRNQAYRAGSQETLARYGSAYGNGPYNREPRAGNALLIPIPSAPAPNLGQTNNLAVLSQFGANNTGTIDQSGGTGNVAVATIVGSSNSTTQTQVGSDSNSVLNVLGNRNTLTAAQTGDRNSYTLNVGGSNNTIAYAQTGNDLSFGLKVLGQGANISIAQTPSTGPAPAFNPSQAPTFLAPGSRR
jgi:hypothetical protein